MAQYFIRKRITRRPTPEEAARYRQALKEVEADKEAIIARGRELLKKLKSQELQNVAQVLRDARLKKGLSASDVADRLQMDAGNYSRLESGQTNPTLQTLSRMAEAIGVKVTVNVQGL